MSFEPVYNTRDEIQTLKEEKAMREHDCKELNEEIAGLKDELKAMTKAAKKHQENSVMLDQRLKECKQQLELCRRLKKAGPRGLRQEILWTNYDPKEIRDLEQTGMEDFV